MKIGNKVVSNWYLAGGGTVALLLGYMYKKQKASTAAAANTSAVVDPNAIDPNTGYPYGTSTYDSANGYYSQGYSPAYGGAYGNVPSAYGYMDPVTGQFIGGAGTHSTVITAPTTNAQWAQQAIAYLVQIGYDGITVTTAIGKYLANTNLTSNEMQIVQAAMAAEGNPPVTVPAPHVAPPGGQTPPPPPPVSTIKEGYYYKLPLREVYQVVGGKYYRVDPLTWANFGAGHKPPFVATVTGASPIFKLPFGGHV